MVIDHDGMIAQPSLCVCSPVDDWSSAAGLRVIPWVQYVR